MIFFSERTILYNRILYFLKKYNNFLIIGHKKPDGDAIGSMLALRLALKKLGKNTILACDDAISQRFNILPESDKIIELSNYAKSQKNVEIIITLDSATYELTGLNNYFQKDKLPLIINIDHHHDNPRYGNVNYIESNISSVCEIIFNLLKDIKIKITSDIATCILNGIFVDTDSFKNPNTSIRTLRITSYLLSRGANLKAITRYNLKDKSLSALKLWGLALARLSKNNKFGIISTIITREDLNKCSAVYEDLEGVANFLNSIPEAKASLVLSERDKNEIKGSFRTLHDNIDVSKIAALFGGGGHKKAAGFSIHGKLINTQGRWKIL